MKRNSIFKRKLNIRKSDKGHEKRNDFFQFAPFDMNLLLVVLLLNIFGLIMIYSASYSYAINAGEAPYNYVLKQFIFALAGTAGLFFISFLRPRYFNQKVWLIVFAVLSIALVAAVRSPIGHASHGAYRWIKLGPLQLQVAEPVKVCVIGAMAYLIAHIKLKFKLRRLAILAYGMIVAVMLAVISNNYSTAFIIAVMVYMMMLISEKNPKWYLILMGVILAAAVGVVIYCKVVPYGSEGGFRLTRIRAWLNPDDPMYSSDEAFQSVRALYAVASGGFFGKGLGQSLMKFKLPEPHNDYILAIVFEELGIFGVLILVFLYLYLFYRIFRIFIATRDKFSKQLVLGVFLHLVTQTALNFMVCTGLFPTTGVTLPFISYGGSAVLFTLLEIGIVLMVQRQNTEDAMYAEAEKELRIEDPEYQQIINRRENDAKIRRIRAEQKRKRMRKNKRGRK